MSGLVIRKGEVVSALDRYVADVYCNKGVIESIGQSLQVPAGTQELDASGCFVFPGAIDAHTHMELPVGDLTSADDFFTGTAAAAAGGTTTIIDFISPERGQSLLEARDLWYRKAEKACIDYAFHMAVTWFGDEVARDMRQVRRDDGITSFKTYMAYLDSIGVRDAELLRIMEVVADLGALVTVHAENGDVVKELQRQLVAAGNVAPRFHPVSRPPWVEGEAAARALALARCHGVPIYIVHTSTREALEAMSRARLDGQVVYAETCPQYLVLDASAYDQPDFEGAAYVLSPPLRPRGHQDALWSALRAGLVQTIATDHCPFRQADQKVRGKDDFTKIPNGAGGVEDRLRLVYTYGVAPGRLTLQQLVELCCTRPAQIFGLYPQKGAIRTGSDADLVVYDPGPRGTITAAAQQQRTDRNIYEGLAVSGAVRATIARGQVIFGDGALRVRRGAGRYLKRS
jgi:dihydropyrimidinase